MKKKERPILFSGAMVRSILEGRKTQTRRVVQVQPSRPEFDQLFTLAATTATADRRNVGKHSWGRMVDNLPEGDDVYFSNPFNVDRLWVRETFCQKCDDNEMPVYNAAGNMDSSCCYYRADGVEVYFPDGGGWTPSIFMPRWASRIDLEVLKVRIERLQDITDGGAIAEGCYKGFPLSDGGVSWVSEFAHLWNSINGQPRKNGVDISWAANPWVWVVEFGRVKVGAE